MVLTMHGNRPRLSGTVYVQVNILTYPVLLIPSRSFTLSSFHLTFPLITCLLHLGLPPLPYSSLLFPLAREVKQGRGTQRNPASRDTPDPNV
ncbi:hypothetical protein E2C01_023762 [Portunus trituberculatus]|uniref:Uncharacterized protein n=1 Tax=Portunus trituberculatus TaxID=210409 RepID=A0A5B7EAW8_PORTR|nr:hypothetical protein [Portunus trituberculatus]